MSSPQNETAFRLRRRPPGAVPAASGPSPYAAGRSGLPLSLRRLTRQGFQRVTVCLTEMANECHCLRSRHAGGCVHPFKLIAVGLGDDALLCRKDGTLLPVLVSFGRADGPLLEVAGKADTLLVRKNRRFC